MDKGALVVSMFKESNSPFLTIVMTAAEHRFQGRRMKDLAVELTTIITAGVLCSRDYF